MNEEIEAIIRKNLPEQVSKELKEYIIQAEKNKQNFEYLEQEEKRNKGIISKLNKDNDNLKKELAAFEEREKELFAREQSLLIAEKNFEKRETKLELTIFDIKLKEAERRADNLFQLTETIFKNQTVKRRVIDEPIVRDHYTNRYNSQIGDQEYVKTGDYVENKQTCIEETIDNA